MSFSEPDPSVQPTPAEAVELLDAPAGDLPAPPERSDDADDPGRAGSEPDPSASLPPGTTRQRTPGDGC